MRLTKRISHWPAERPLNFRDVVQIIAETDCLRRRMCRQRRTTAGCRFRLDIIRVIRHIFEADIHLPFHRRSRGPSRYGPVVPPFKVFSSLWLDFPDGRCFVKQRWRNDEIPKICVDVNVQLNLKGEVGKKTHIGLCNAFPMQMWPLMPKSGAIGLDCWFLIGVRPFDDRPAPTGL